MKKNIFAITFLCLGWAALPLSAEVMTYQGRLKESNVPVNANRTFLFEFCATETPTGCVASADGAKPFAVQNGLFKSTFTLPAVDLSAGPWYLRVQVEGSYLSPVERLTFVPYSLYASTAGYSPAALQKAGDTMTGQLTSISSVTITGNGGVYGLQVSSNVSLAGALYSANGNIGIGTTAPQYPLVVLGNSAGNIINAGNAANPGGDTAGFGLDTFAAYPGAALYVNNAKVFNVESNGGAIIGSTYMTADAVRNGLIVQGQVGIGTALPNYALEISSGGGEAGTIMSVSTGATNLFWVAGDGAHSMKFTGDGSGLTGVTGAAGTDSSKLPLTGGTLAGQLTLAGSTLTVTGDAFSVGGSTLVVINGNVGIGTATASQKLQVVGNIRLGGDGNSDADYSLTTGGQLLIQANDTGTDTLYSNLALAAGSASSQVLGDYPMIGFQTMGVERLRINSTGNVGIGEASPLTRLDVRQENGFNALLSVAMLTHMNSGAAAAGIGSRVSFAGENSAGGVGEAVAIGGILTDVTAGSEAGAMIFETRTGGGPFAERMRIDATGNIGIGTNSPQQKLHASAGLGGVKLRLEDTAMGFWDIWGGGDLLFMPNGASTSLFLKGSNGNIGIGTISPSYRLVVSSGAGETGIIMAVSTGTTNIFSVDGSGVNALRFTGDGSGLTGVTGASGTDSSKLPLAGGTMSGPLTLAGSTLTVTGDAFSVGGSTLVVTGGYLGLGTNAPASRLHVVSDNGYVTFASPNTPLTMNMVPQTYAAAILNNNGDGPLGFSIANNVQMWIDRQTLVGIGTQTPLYRLHVSSGAGETGTILAVSTGATNIFTVDGSGVNAIRFTGDGSGLTNLPAPGGFVSKAGDTMIGQLTNTSSVTITGNGGVYGLEVSSNVSLAGALYSANGKVGIGTTGPVSRLDIKPLADNGASGLHVRSFNSDSKYISLWRGDNGGVIDVAGPAATPPPYLGITFDGTEKVRIDSSGNVGIGTTVPGAPLQVGDGVTAGSKQIRIDVPAASSALFQIYKGGVSTWEMYVPPGSNDFRFYDGSGDKVTFQDGGNVGIGTTGPSYRLHVSSGAGEAGIIMAVSTGTSVVFGVKGNGEISGGKFIGDGSGLTNLPVPGGLVSIAGDTMIGQLTNTSSVTITGNGGAYGLQVSSNVSLAGALYSANGNVGIATTTPQGLLHVGAGATPGLLVDNAGNVGISTATPETKLHVRGSIKTMANNGLYTDNGANYNISLIGYDGSAVIINQSLSGMPGTFVNNSNVKIYSSGLEAITVASNQTTIAGGASNNWPRLLVNGGMRVGYSGANSLHVSTTGNVGIAVADAAYRLHVSSGAGETGTLMAVSTGATNLFWVAGDGAHATKYYGDGSGITGVSATDATKLPLAGGTMTGNLNMGGMNIYAASTVTASGDITAARYQIGGSTVLAVLPGTGSLGIGFDAGTANYGDGNLFVGKGAGKVNDSGINNSFLGSEAGYSNTTGGGNSFLGYYAGRTNNFGGGNTFVGNQAGLNNDGDNNSFFGAAAGTANSAGNNNVFIGALAGLNATGSNNIVIGYNKGTSQPAANSELNIGGLLYGDLSAKTIGISTRVPQAALDIVSTGTAQTQFAQIWRDGSGVIKSSMSATGVLMAGKFIGDGSGLTGVSATDATKLPLTGGTMAGDITMGANDLYAVSTITATGDITAARYQIAGSTVLAVLPGVGSLGVGVNAGRVNTGSDNSFLGIGAGYSNTTGGKNSFLGLNAGYNNTTGINNSLLGASAGYSNTTGSNNSFLGQGAGYTNTTGSGNSFLGSYAGNSNTTGGSNSFLGMYAGYSNTTGSYNSFLGYYVGTNTGAGSANAVFGAEAGKGVANNSFSSSTIMGFRAGYGLTTGSDNILLGFQAGYNVTSGMGNIVIGYNKDTSAAAANNELNIGGVIYGNLSAKTIGISTRVPEAALDVVSTGTVQTQFAQIWRDGSGVIKSSMSATGVLMAGKFVGDGSALSGVSATDATKLPLTGGSLSGAFSVNSASVSIRYANEALYIADPAGGMIPDIRLARDALSYWDIGGAGGGTPLVFQYAGNDRLFITSEGHITINDAGQVTDRLRIRPGVSDAYALRVSSSDGLTNNLALKNSGELSIVGPLLASDNISAARYQIKGSTVVAILPGSESLGIGVNAGRVNAGNYNVFVGSAAGYSNTTASNNSFLGYMTGYSNTTGTDNSFVGSAAGYSNVSGTSNSIFGSFAGYFNTTGISNSFMGYNAGRFNTTGAYNSFEGAYAGYSNTTGGDNAYVGYRAGFENKAGSANAIVGNQAGAGVVNNSFSSTTLMGYKAGFGLTTGSDNILLGFQAGYNVTTGTGNIVIGYGKDTSAPGANNELNIGGVLYGNLSARTIGISTRVPQAALDIVSTGTVQTQFAQIWRDGSGVIKSSMSATGVLMATKFVGDGSALSGVSATDATKLPLGGGTLTGQLTNTSSVTITGNGGGAYGLEVSSNVTLAGILYSANGNIGVGSTAPGAKLDIYSFNTTSFLEVHNASFGNKKSFRVFQSNNHGLLDVFDTAETIAIRLNADNTSPSYINAGKVGIGTTLPDQNLTVAGNISQTGVLISSGTGDNYFAGNVGVGTTTPVAKLHVVGAGGALIDLDNTNGIINGQLMVRGQTNPNRQLWLGYDTTNNYGLVQAYEQTIGGKPLVLQPSSGNVGIGTTVPKGKLDVAGGISAGSYAGVNTPPSNGMIISGNVGIGTTVPDQKLTVAGNISQTGVLISSGTGDNYFNGRVGIGITTPQSHLHVDDALNATATGVANLALLVRHNTITAGGGPGIGFSSDNTYSLGAKIVHIRTGSNSQGDLAFYTKTTNAVPESEKMRIRDNGNVGISTGLPEARLDVLAGGSTQTDMAQIWRNSAGTTVSSVSATGVLMANKFVGDGSGLNSVSASDPTKLPLSGGTLTGQLTIAASSLTVRSNAALSPLLISTSPTPSVAGLYVDGSNNVGIGTTLPAYKLDIVGQILRITDPGNATIYLNSAGTTFNITSAGGVWFLRDQTNDPGGTRIAVTAAGLVGMGSASPGSKLGVSGNLGIGAGYVTTAAPLNGAIIEGRVGIGTTAPSRKLEVNGEITASRYEIGGSTVVAILPGIESLGVGINAGRVNTGDYNVFVGLAAGYNNTIGIHNSFLGASAGNSNTTGEGNSFVGYKAGYSNTSGGNNSFMGASAGYSNTTGWDNSTAGLLAGYYNKVGSANAIFGNEAGFGVSNNSFSSSTLMGYRAGYNLQNGSADNIFVGFQAGNNVTTGTGNIVIGYDKDTSAPGASNELNIGGVIYGNLSAGYVGVGAGVTNPGGALQVGQNGLIISTGGAIQTTGLGHGSTAGSARGVGAVDLQTFRTAASQVASGLYAVVSGGYGNTSSNYSFVGGGYTNLASGGYSVAGGGQSNLSSNGWTTVAGGSNNIASQNNATVGGGSGNIAAGYSATVAGGSGNNVQSTAFAGFIGGGGNNISTGAYSTVGGGQLNISSGAYSAVLGGYRNVAQGPNSGVAGGSSNLAYGANSAVTGGKLNSAWGDFSTVSGGNNNSTTGLYSIIAGGDFNSAGGQGSAVVGGNLNNASGTSAFIGGGGSNEAKGWGAVVFGGNSAAMGGFSFAAGYRSTSAVDGTFTWSDSQGIDVVNNVPDQVMFKAKGGFWVSTGTVYTDPGLYVSAGNRVGIGTAVPTAKLHVGGTPGVDGIRFPDGSLQTTAGLGSASDVTNPTDAIINGDSDGNQSGSVKLKTAGLDRVHVSTGGQVGIGTTNPSVMFHNAGSAILASNYTTIDPDSYGSAVIAGALSDAGWTVSAGIGGMVTNAGTTWGIGHNNVDLLFAAGDATNPNTLQTFMQATWKRNLALVPVSGKVGIGTSAIPDQKLTVIGSISQTGVLISSGAGNSYFAGNIGIGTNTPVAMLDVNGTARLARHVVESRDSGGTMSADDFGKTITVNSASPQAIALPVGTAGSVGAQFTFVKLGTGKLTLNAGATDFIADSSMAGNIYNDAVSPAFATITLRLVTSNKWMLVGGEGAWVTQ